jgi:hypothetical protein
MRYEFRRAVVLIVGGVCGMTAIPGVSAQPSAAPSACGLLSREAVEQVLGTSLGNARVGANNGDVTSCSFPIKGGGSISILLRRNANRAWIAEQEERMNLGDRYGNFRPVAGLGEKTFVLDMRDAGAAVCVLGAASCLQVSVFRAGTAATVFAKVEKLAEAALTNPLGAVTKTARGRVQAIP